MKYLISLFFFFLLLLISNQTLFAQFDEENSFSSQNQEKSFSFGIHAGIIGSTGYYQYHDGPEPPIYSVLANPAAGCNFNFQIGKGFSIESTLGYRGKGDRIDMGEWLLEIEPPIYSVEWITAQTEGEGYVQTRLGYIELGFFPVIHFSEGFRMGVGGYGAIGVHGKEKSDYKISHFFEGSLIDVEIVDATREIEFVDLISGQDTETTRYINSLDYGLGVFFDFGRKPLTFRFTGNYGLQTWQPDTDLFGNSELPKETYHVLAMFSVQYWFGKTSPN